MGTGALFVFKPASAPAEFVPRIDFDNPSSAPGAPMILCTTVYRGL